MVMFLEIIMINRAEPRSTDKARSCSRSCVIEVTQQLNLNTAACSRASCLPSHLVYVTLAFSAFV